YGPPFRRRRRQQSLCLRRETWKHSTFFFRAEIWSGHLTTRLTGKRHFCEQFACSTKQLRVIAASLSPIAGRPLRTITCIGLILTTPLLAWSWPSPAPGRP